MYGEGVWPRLGAEGVEVPCEQGVGGLGLRVGEPAVVTGTGVRECGSSQRMSHRKWPDDATTTTRAPTARDGWRRLTRAKCPSWLMAKCASQPGPTRVPGQAITPAPLMTMSRVRSEAGSAGRTDGRCQGRPGRANVLPPRQGLQGLLGGIGRAGTMTCAPAPASARVTSRPSPEYPPVTRAVVPVRSISARTSTAVLWAPKPAPSSRCSVIRRRRVGPGPDARSSRSGKGRTMGRTHEDWPSERSRKRLG